jgi:hypothetical protein
MRSGCNSASGGEIHHAVAVRIAVSGRRYRADGAQFHLDAVPAIRAEAHFFGDFAIERSASQFGGQCVGHGIHLLLPFAQIARSPIELAQAVEDGALDAMLGISMEGHILRRVVLGDGIEQPEYAGVREIVQIHMHGKVFMNANGDGLHQG